VAVPEWKRSITWFYILLELARELAGGSILYCFVHLFMAKKLLQA